MLICKSWLDGRELAFPPGGYWLSGQDISATNLGNNIFTVSNIAGFPTFRMNELWFQQNFMNDRISIRLGQLAADSQFCVSTYATVFLNGTFAWSPDLYTNILNGGPAYPMGAPGVQLALTPLEWLSLPGGCLSRQCFRPKRQSAWIPLGPKPL